MFAQELIQTLSQLAHVNLSGAPFLLCYGMTWTLCGVLWRKTNEPLAGYATLFQGLIALPIALGISYAIGSFSNRPGGDAITQLSVLLATSQLFVIPLLIVFHAKKHYTMIPFVFAMASAIHFVPYSWLYRTPVYIGMAAVVSLGTTFFYHKGLRDKTAAPSSDAASHACLLTGVVMLATALYFVVTR